MELDGMGLHWAGMGLDRLALGWLKLGWDASGMLMPVAARVK